jgi:hypothetical protein
MPFSVNTEFRSIVNTDKQRMNVLHIDKCFALKTMDRNFNGKCSAGICIPCSVLCFLGFIWDENSCPTRKLIKTDHRRNMCRISRIDYIESGKFYHSVWCTALTLRSWFQILFGAWMYVYLFVYLCCVVWVQDLRRADLPSKESHPISKQIYHPQTLEAFRRIGLYAPSNK